jgi:hypothetical protein
MCGSALLFAATFAGAAGTLYFICAALCAVASLATCWIYCCVERQTDSEHRRKTTPAAAPVPLAKTDYVSPEIFAIDEVVTYVREGSPNEYAVVVAVHMDTEEPYYTVRTVRNGAERNTDAAHLRKATRVILDLNAPEQEARDFAGAKVRLHRVLRAL